VIFLWILGHNILYTYVAPFAAAHRMAGQVPLVLLVFGVSAVAGIWVTGVLVDRGLRRVTLTSLAGFATAALVLGIAGDLPVLVYVGVAAWGLTFGGAPTLLQTAIADAAGDSADVAQSMLVTVFNLAVAGGGAVGGLLLAGLGAGSFAWAQLVLAAAALAVVGSASAHGFRPGARMTE